MDIIINYHMKNRGPARPDTPQMKNCEPPRIWFNKICSQQYHEVEKSRSIYSSILEMQILLCSKAEGFSACKRVLTKAQVQEIYEFHITESNSTSIASFVKRTGSTSSRLAARYGVSPKTIRDIWNGRTWTSVTSRLVDNESLQWRHQAVCDFLDQQVYECHRHTLCCSR